MITDSIQFQIIEDKIAAFETLIVSQQSKIDSLSMIVHDNKIAEGFFYSILSSQLQTFSVIIVAVFTVIGIVSWRLVTSEVKKLQRKFDTKIKGIETKVEKAYMLGISSEFNMSRTMVFISEDSGDYLIAFLWCMRACECEVVKNDFKEINKYLLTASENLSQYKKGSCDEKVIDDANRIVQYLFGIEGVDKKELKSIRKIINSMDPFDDDKS